MLTSNLEASYTVFYRLGKVYYYHTITRKTQWERPTEKDVEGTITMDLGTPEPESGSEHEEVDVSMYSTLHTLHGV